MKTSRRWHAIVQRASISKAYGLAQSSRTHAANVWCHGRHLRIEVSRTAIADSSRGAVDSCKHQRRRGSRYESAVRVSPGNRYRLSSGIGLPDSAREGSRSNFTYRVPAPCSACGPGVRDGGESAEESPGTKGAR